MDIFSGGRKRSLVAAKINYTFLITSINIILAAHTRGNDTHEVATALLLVQF